jgi:hypothetical protein
MAVIEEGKNLGDLLKYEIDRNFCRETVTVASGQNLKFGTVVGMKTATGEVKIVSIASQETDGSDEVVGIILEDVNATDGAKKAVTISIGAMVAYDSLIFPEGATDAQKKAIIKGLFQRAIRVVKTV